jgi:hypothetical protein
MQSRHEIRKYTQLRRETFPAASLDAAAHSALLVQRIADEIAVAGGWLSFDRYMALAVYAPGLGYYAAGAHKLGDAASGGDFVTAPEISSLFGAALSVQAEEVLAASGPNIVELEQRGIEFLSPAAAEETRELRLGIVGCGGRGSGAVNDSLLANTGFKLALTIFVGDRRLALRCAWPMAATATGLLVGLALA